MNDDNELAPMVDALTGAMSAILLISVFLMLNTLSGVNDSIKEYSKQSLYSNQEKIHDVLNRKEPDLFLDKKTVSFYRSFKLSNEQIAFLNNLFEKDMPKKLTIYSNEDEDIITYNALLFITGTVLSQELDHLKIIYLPSRNGGFTEFVWE